MAKQFSNSGIASGSVIRPGHVTQSVDAFTGTDAYDITISGSLTLTGSFSIDNITASLFGTASWANNVVSASYSTTSSYSDTSVSASYSDTSITSSYITGSGVDGPFGLNSVVSSSYSVSSSQAISSSYAVSSSQTVSASYSDTSVTSSFITGSDVYGPFGSNSIISASYAVTSSLALNFNGLTTGGPDNPTPQPNPGNSSGMKTTDSQPLIFSTSDTQRLKLDGSGSIIYGTDLNGSITQEVQRTTQTSGSETKTIVSFTSDSNASYTVQAYIAGWGNTSGSIGGDVISAFQNLGGTLNQIGTPNSNSFENFSGTPSFTLTGSGTDIILQVTGQTSTDIFWSANLKHISYNLAK